ncbi:preprotein translocase subunit SecE [Candidatus Berkelbacteria bacterium]|nr:preprotein translocase subunit SecE [Candidatus Berkelbacteria bacterium]
MIRPIAYLRESYDELRKVKWPSRETTIQYTLTVIGAVILLTTFYGLIDFGLSEIISRMLNRS